MLSIIIPAYKAQDFILETIMAFQNQTISIEYEIIVVVDGCIDTLTVLNDIDEPRLRVYYCDENKGRYSCTNTGIDLARGTEYLFWDADDIAFNNLFEELGKVDADIIQFKYQRFHEVIEKKLNDVKSGSYQDNPFTYKKVQKREGRILNDYANGILYMKRIVIDYLGGYEDWKCSADTEFLKRVDYFNFKHIRIDKPLFLYRQHNGSLTSTVASERRRKYGEIIKNKNYTDDNVYVHKIMNIGIIIPMNSINTND